MKVILQVERSSCWESPPPPPAPLEDSVLAPAPLRHVNGTAHPDSQVNGSTPQAPVEPAAPSPPVYHAPTPVPAEVKPSMPANTPAAPASSEKETLNARRTDIENPPEKQPASIVEDTEKVKKRQSFLTRTLWTFIMIGGFISEYRQVHA